MEKIVTGKFQTNLYLVDSKDDCVLIDPGYDIKKHLEKINKYNVVAILLTHCHADHIDGIGEFDCPIYIHELDYEGLKNNVNSLYDMIGDKPSFNFNDLDVIKFKDNDILAFNKFTFQALHTPGHTKGSSCFLYKDVLFTGDTLFKDSVGRTDFPTGDHQTLLKSIKKLIDKLDQRTKILPGHGNESTIKDEKKSNIFLRTF